ncbi:unnamed protein product [Cyclocybe aegerita]|uniref:DUF6534 domain-containing protein n=1 Tax=Cyclocybe aegerita TaxID=1973307 RepID=A0A8S0VZG7_CYCAE|nr:unnamed protein product [Cyclocybe aegerita]
MSLDRAALNALFGPELVGMCVGMLLQGMLFSQMHNYFNRYRDDSRLNKNFVLYIVLLETVSSGVTVALVYQPLILEFGQESAVNSVPLGLIIIPPIVVAIATPIHLYVARRIHILHESIWVPLIICTLSFASMAGGIWSSVATVHNGIYVQHLPAKLLSPALLWMVAAAVADLLIAAALSWSLYNRKTGYKSTDAVIDRIIFFTVQTGVVTAIAALLSVITLVALPLSNTTTYVFNVTLMKLYGNFILATLNNRASWNDTLNRTDTSVLFPQSAISAGPDTFPSNWQCQCRRRPTVTDSIPLSFARSREGQDPRNTTVEYHDSKDLNFSPSQAV